MQNAPQISAYWLEAFTIADSFVAPPRALSDLLAKLPQDLLRLDTEQPANGTAGCDDVRPQTKRQPRRQSSEQGDDGATGPQAGEASQE